MYPSVVIEDLFSANANKEATMSLWIDIEKNVILSH